MRITGQMITNTVVFDMQRSLRRFFDMQSQMSSGRRINQPSDDPSGTVRDLSYRTELAKTAQYQENVASAMNWMTNYDSQLADLKDFVTSAKELSVAMINGTYDEVARMASANEVKSYFDQMIHIANSEMEGRSVFAGFQTRSQPFTVSANGVRYGGDAGRIEFEVDTGLRQTINFNGSEVFLKSLSILGEDADLNPAVSAATLLAELNGGDGADLVPGTFTITDVNSGTVANIDLSATAPPTVGQVVADINTQLTAQGITNLTVALGDEGNNLRLETTQDGIISTDTLLKNLNDGNGVDLLPGSILVSDGGAVNFEVDFSGAQTIDDVINTFNAEVAAQGLVGVTMSLNGTATGLQIDDAGGNNLTISETADSEFTARNLGITGIVGTQLVGGDLDPLVHFSISEAGGATAASLGLIGDFNRTGPGADIDPVLSVDTLLSDLQNGNGFNTGDIVIWQGERRLDLDLDGGAIGTVQELLDAINTSNLEITASLNAAGTGIQITNDDPDRSLTIEDVGDGTAAKDLGIFGSSDLLGSMLVLANSLEKDDVKGVDMLLQNLDDGIQHLLDYRSTVGARTIRIETTNDRLAQKEIAFTESLSLVEDADISELITQLATMENNYQTALMATAKIVQPSLLDFLS